MSALGKVHASVWSAAQETAISLAHLNFDFSLFKFEAPLEYQSIRNHLSSARLKAAEEGSEHVVARKLHGLFVGEMPDTPRLVEVYGRRATEIIESRDTNPHETNTNGIFQQWIGTDATSLWAAATSGYTAITVHLLACMLARMFPSSEATAIWEELVMLRKLAISNPDKTDPLYFPKVAAANMDISRQQLANWDASARAWLTVADQANAFRQTQVRLIVRNIVLPVNQRNNVLQSVMEAWKSALTSVENILKGISCTVTDGAVLLALSSWHIYPNIHVMGHDVKKVNQADNLVPEDVLVTLGASNASPDSANGVYWSLPLSHLRYYGDPVLASRSLTDHVNRLSRVEVLMTVLGSILATWAKNGDDIDEAAKLVCKLSSYLFQDHPESNQGALHWLQHLSAAAREFLSAQGSERDHFRSLINRGKHCYGDFLGAKNLHPKAMFGLQDISDVLTLAATEEDKIAILRIFAEGLNATPDSLLIRFKPSRHLDIPEQQLFHPQQDSDDNSEPKISLNDAWDQLMLEEPSMQESQWEYATAIPISVSSGKRKRAELDTLARHMRWTEMGKPRPREASILHQADEMFSAISEVSLDYRPSTGFKWALKSSLSPATCNSEKESTHFRPWAGEVETAAIFKRANCSLQTTGKLTVNKLLRLLEEKLIKPENLMSHLDFLGDLHQSSLSPYTQSLRALAAAMDAYLLMPGATISNTAFSKPLHTAQWASLINLESTSYHIRSSTGQGIRHKGSHLLQPITRRLDRQQLFACIAMFENRSVDLDPSMLESVFAVAADNSIYIATPLTCDPCDHSSADMVKHVIGNIGKSGITLMIPPPVPKIRPTDAQSWKPLNHKAAPQVCEYGDSFQRTSLHLSFTRYELAADTRNHGFQDVEARFLETIVSIYDRDEWVADLDILKALDSKRLIVYIAPLPEDSGRQLCQHLRCQSNHTVPAAMKLTLIDDWEELLIPSWTGRLFRAEGNKFARLGAVALAIQRGHLVVVFKDRDSICWQCFAEGRMSSLPRDMNVASTSTDEADEPTFIC